MFHMAAKAISPVAPEPQGLLLQESSWTRKQSEKSFLNLSSAGAAAAPAPL